MHAIAVAPGMSPSDAASSKLFEITAAAVTFSANGTVWAPGDKEGREYYVVEAMISLETSTPDAVIVYTTDGNFPSATHGTKYDGPIEDSTLGPKTLKAIVYAAGMRPSPFAVSPVYDIIARADRPKFEPSSGGPFVSKVTVSISNYVPNSGSAVHLSVGGEEPTMFSQMYSGPFEIDTIGTTVVKAYMTKPGRADSNVAEASFTVLEQVATPTIDITSGTFEDEVTVHLACATPEARIRYTTDGSEPNAASAEYTDGITLGLAPDGSFASYVVKAIAIKAPEMGNSLVLESGTFTVQPPASPPEILPDADEGPYPDNLRITLESPTPGASVKYTDDGSDPTTSPTSKTYTGPFVMSADSDADYPFNFTLKAFVEHDNMRPSEVVTADYQLQLQACSPTFSRAGGTFVVGVPISITCTNGEPADVYFSLIDDSGEGSVNGTLPEDSESVAEDSNLYSGPIELTDPGNWTIKAVAIAPGILSSAVRLSPQYVVVPEDSCEEDSYLSGAAANTSASHDLHWHASYRLCKECPEGGTSPADSVGQFACVAGAGYFGPAGGIFLACPVGTYRAQEDPEDKCVPCPAWSTTLTSAATSIDECVSELGFEGVSPGPFTPCPIGWYSEAVGEPCVECPEGGTTWAEESIGLKSCIADQGWTNKLNWDAPPFEICEKGRYKPLKGPGNCKLCPYCSTTEGPGATSLSMCVADVADAECGYKASGSSIGWEVGFVKCKPYVFCSLSTVFCSLSTVLCSLSFVSINMHIYISIYLYIYISIYMYMYICISLSIVFCSLSIVVSSLSFVSIN